jgi:hypothetical protein
MSKVIITWDSNWADEMDIAGFSIVSDKEAKDLKKKLNDRQTSFTICVGTNEDIEYSDGSELLGELSFKKISDEDAKVIRKYVGDEFGFTEFLTQVEYWDDGEDEDDEDED